MAEIKPRPSNVIVCPSY